MKNIFYFCFAIFFLATIGCDEIPPNIAPPPNGGGTGGGEDLSMQPRHVLIEEFTGVRCVNCPEGSEQIEAMLAAQENLIAVSIHAGFFSVPYNESMHDFNTADGNAFLDYLDQPQGFPTAVVNRKEFNGEDDLQLVQSSWNGHVASELAEAPKIRIGLEHTYDTDNRQLDIDLTFLPAETLDNENLRYTVMITENNIVDPQATLTESPDPDYKHKHVFRDVITDNFDGNPIDNEIWPNVSFQKSLSYTLSSGWNADECSIIAFVNYSSADNKEILQAVETYLVK